jgi:hypothetical protein
VIRFLIMAGTAKQAKSIADHMGLQPSEWKYVSEWSDLFALRGLVMLMCGTWEKRQDAREIFNMAQQRDMRLLYIN